MFTWQVSSKESGNKLLAFIKEKVGEGYSLRFLKKAIENNLCKVNGRVERFATTIVGRGDTITLKLNAKQESTPKKMVFEPACILYEDEHFLIYNKPSGLSSDGEHFLQALHKHNSQLELIHRLDRDTTGVLMFAKNEEIREMMITLFRKHEVKKVYFALVDGIPKKAHGIIDNYLGKKRSFDGQSIWGEVGKDQGIHAVTEWEMMKKGKEASLLACYPKTGRTHQIRVHLSGMGHPILGDHQYGRIFKSSYQATRYSLHASEISFLHPISGQLMTFKAPLPEDFQMALEELT